MIGQDIEQNPACTQPVVLFVTHQASRCGVYEFGKSTYQALQQSSKFRYVYCSVHSSASDSILIDQVVRHDPCAIVFNWHPITMPWLTDKVLGEIKRLNEKLRFLSLVHDEPAPWHWIDSHLSLDPTYSAGPCEFTVGRRIPSELGPKNVEDTIPIADSSGPNQITIGSFGFGLPGKGFERVIQAVNSEFEKALVRIHVPSSEFCDNAGALNNEIAERCRVIAKPGIQVQVTSDYKTNRELVRWLSENSINCFFYDEYLGRGISSVIDLALAARSPIAISDSYMFRHIRDVHPTILIERSTIREIMSNGVGHLSPLLDRWNDQELVKRFDTAVEQALRKPTINLKSNRVLTPSDRTRLGQSIAELYELCPHIMSRKLPEAVFQNAFIYEQAKSIARPGDRIVLIGGYEDPIGPALARQGWDVTITDPVLDGRSLLDVLAHTYENNCRFDLVISCSVLEHVEDDLEFLEGILALLKTNGTALLTTDFRHNWAVGLDKPAADARLYSLQRLAMLKQLLPENVWLDPPDWQAIAPYFHFDGCDYGFCSIAFQSRDERLGPMLAAKLLARERKLILAKSTAISNRSKSSDVADFLWIPSELRDLQATVHASLNSYGQGSAMATTVFDCTRNQASVDTSASALPQAAVSVPKVKISIRKRIGREVRRLKKQFIKASTNPFA